MPMVIRADRCWNGDRALVNVNWVGHRYTRWSDNISRTAGRDWIKREYFIVSKYVTQLFNITFSDFFLNKYFFEAGSFYVFFYKNLTHCHEKLSFTSSHV